jgi:hypothetical protein
MIEKRNSKKQNIYTGRCDLYIKIGKREFILEAKHVWSPAGEKAHNPVSKIRYYLGEARKAVKRIKSDDGEERLAVVFAAPYIPTSQKTIIDDRINNWIAQIKKIKYSSAAWIFPPKARTPLPKERWIYPGVALVIKKIS